jgi:hypothetical protein
MKQNWVLLSAILAILAVPFALAAFEDASVERPEPRPYDDPAAALEPAGLDEMEMEMEMGLEAGPHGVAAFERREPLDLSFLDLLDRRRPVPAADLASAVPFGEPETAAFATLRHRLETAANGPGVQLEHLSDGAVAGVRFSFPAEPAVGAALELRWGEPSSAVAGAGAVWLDATTRLRAVLRETAGTSTLAVGPYRPLDEMLRLRRDGSFELEPSGLIGAAKAELDGLGASPSAGVWTLEVLPPAASAAPTTSISCVDDGSRVVEVTITIDLSLDRGAATAAEASLAREVGAPSLRAPIGDAVELQWSRRPDLRAFVYPDRLIIYRTPRAPQPGR